ncbi:hypothetical protein BDI4_580063 [Burkholderia diffusa]|nr:hypothetical protein BDI4_580063 [Burkholderia diffusa]
MSRIICRDVMVRPSSLIDPLMPVNSHAMTDVAKPRHAQIVTKIFIRNL